MKQYIELGNKLLNEGVWVTNPRTGVKCLTIINHSFEYDVGNKEFPLGTTRRVPYKSAIAELLGYLRGYSSAAQFRAIGTSTWNANANENKAWLANPNRKGEDDMGMAYRFRSQGFFIETPNYRDIEDTTTFALREFPDIEVVSEGIIGSVYTSLASGDYKVIADSGKSADKRIHYYTVQFLDTGFTAVIQKSQLKSGNVKDPYAVSVHGIGVVGTPSEEDRKLLYKTWSHMLGRCYDPNNDAYKNYGGRGCKVAKAWHKFENFVRDCKSLTNWELKAVFPDEYSIDKDWCNSLLYSKETCRWSTSKEQAYNTRNVKHFKVSKDDCVVYSKGLPDLALLVGSSTKKLSSLLSKNELPVTINDFIIDLTDEVQLTYVEVDQLKSIVAKLTLGIDDRRLIMSAHYPHLNEFTCLPACMYEHQFSILGDTLHLTSTQRSVDYALGLRFNMVQCYTLLALMAQITGLKPGKVRHNMVNIHVYEDQLELLKEELTRTPYPAPKLWINPEIKTLQDLETWVTTDDFLVSDYRHHEPIQYPFTV